MLNAALVAAGLDVERWKAEIEKIALPKGSFQIALEDVVRCAIVSKRFSVRCLNPEGVYEEESSGSSSVFGEPGSQNTFTHTHEYSHAHEHHHTTANSTITHSHAHSHTFEHSHEHDRKHEHDHSHEGARSHHHDHVHEHSPGHSHEHRHEHSHEHTHSHEHHGRSVAEITEIIEKSKISKAAKDLAKGIFNTLAKSESRVHGVPPEQVHFHEVGAIDAIVDVVAFAIGYDLLGIEKSIVSPLTLGRGLVKTDHGLYPVPAPAVAYMLEESGAPTSSLVLDYECLTPTGAAILTTICSAWGAPPALTHVDSIGYGAGGFNPKSHPNVVRIMIGESSSNNAQGASAVAFLNTVQSEHDLLVGSDDFQEELIAVIEANIDDCPPDVLAHAAKLCLQQGALDVTIAPAMMKKGRAGHVLTVLSSLEDRPHLERVVLTETSTIGVRTSTVRRLAALREFHTVTVRDSGSIRVKVARDKSGKIVNVKPEFEDCAEVARQSNLSLKTVVEEAISQYVMTAADSDKI